LNLLRIGDKVVSLDKIQHWVTKALEMRARGLSQQEVSTRLGTDRSFISRLETIGEVRKGKTTAIIGFPLKNCREIEKAAREQGVDIVFLMNDEDRWKFVQEKSGADLLNEVMVLISQVRECDAVVMIGSDMRISLAEAILGSKVYGIEIGSSPISEDIYVNPERVTNLLKAIKE
jgi:transcriptional regulator